MKHANKREHQLINKKESKGFILINCRYLFIFIKKLDNNLILDRKPERWSNYFKYNLYDILIQKYN